jgi:hypothetical protein
VCVLYTSLFFLGNWNGIQTGMESILVGVVKSMMHGQLGQELEGSMGLASPRFNPAIPSLLGQQLTECCNSFIHFTFTFVQSRNRDKTSLY